MKYYLILMAISASISANEKSICGDTDDRAVSNDSRVARTASINELAGCTLTMIGRSCAISAGHCVGSLEKASFNVPPSDENGLKESAPEDIYLRTKDFLRYKDSGKGNDWAVVRLMPNSITGKYPGDVQGFYKVALTNTPTRGTRVRITGHGLDSNDPKLSFSQQTNSGNIKKIGRWLNPSLLEHQVDTMGGNSGSSIILEQTDEIIGIHTHGGCNSHGSNQGTLISKNKILKGVIEQCLEWEKSLAD
jgi:V8-like Glu-specific endopeptidase